MTTETAKQGVHACISEREKLLRERITAAIGHSAWTFYGIRDRLSVITHPHRPELGTTYCLDQRPLVTFYPPSMTFEAKDGGAVCNVTHNYRIHPNG